MPTFKKPLTDEDRALQHERMERAGDFATQIVEEADIRGMDAEFVLIAICQVFAGRDPTTTGEVMGAVVDQIRMQPVTKIIQGEALQ